MISAISIACICAVCFAFCWYQWKTARAYRDFPTRRFYVDLFLQIIRGTKNIHYTTHLFFQQLLKSTSPFREKGVCVMLFPQPRILIFKASLMKDIVYEAAVSDKGLGYSVNKLLVGNSLAGIKHEVWKVHRKLLNPAFNRSVLKNSMPSLIRYSRQLVDKIDTMVDKPIEDILDIMKYSSFQSMFDFVLGLNPEVDKFPVLSKTVVETIDMAAELFIERLCRPWLYQDFMLPFFKFGRKYLKFIKEGRKVFREVLHEVFRVHSKEDQQSVTSMGTILTKLYLEGTYSEKDCRDQLKTFIIGGYDTLAITMMWCLYNLGHHPQEQEKAYNEIMSIAPEEDIAYTDLAEMKYLECVIKESMRLYPTAPLSSRKANRDTRCGQYTIPKDSEVVILTYLLHRDPDAFPEPNKFDPERFSESSEVRPAMYMPFAEGYRSCIGKKFAMMEMKIQLAHLLRRFKVTSLNRIDESELDWAMVLLPTKPPRLLFEKRNSVS